MYTVFEMQTDEEGKTAHLPPVDCNEENEAWSAFYSKLSFAAVSSVYIHTVMLCTIDGRLVESRSFMHGNG